ncbi:MAG: endolytic transglycosylase MltG [Patescibacteria group bacterium]
MMFFAGSRKITFVEKFSIVVLVFLFIAGFFSVVFSKNFDFSDVGGEEAIDINIFSGMSFNEIADKLYFAGLIKSKVVFKIYAMLLGKTNMIKSGFYQINSSASLAELLNILEKGPEEITATIFPGMTLREIDDYFSNLKIIRKGDLIKYSDEFKNNIKAGGLKKKFLYLDAEKSLEGYLLPDTYYFYKNSDIGFVIEKIVSNFNDKVLPFFKDYDNLKNTLKIASLLEKEISNDDDQRIVAGILEKRLKVGMPLQIDATIVYIKCEGRFLNCGQLKRNDYKIDSHFNTYMYTGLIPAPISNPSLSTIKAAINKKDSPYWYYLSDAKTGKTIFSKTFDEHNVNRSVYFLK